MIKVFEDVLNKKEFDVFYNLKRFNGLRINKEETVAHHTYFVVFISRILAENLFCDASYKLAISDMALLHDFKEMYDFDINHTVKYNDFNGEEIREIIDKFVEYEFDKNFPNGTISNDWIRTFSESNGTYKTIIKTADWFSCVFYLRKELGMGNNNIVGEYRKSIKNFNKFCIKLELEVNADESTIYKSGSDTFLKQLVNFSKQLLIENI